MAKNIGVAAIGGNMAYQNKCGIRGARIWRINTGVNLARKRGSGAAYSSVAA